MIRRISHELKHHVPFTFAGTVVGAAIMIAMTLAKAPHEVSHVLFAIAHPTHVLLSAMVTAAMYRLHGRGRWWATAIIGYVGSIGIATLSDSLIPYVGEALLGLPRAHVHAGFIELWYLVNPLALAGVAIGYFWPTTKFPHAGHVLLSTWASLMHMMMAVTEFHAATIAALTAFLFVAVWLPCCTSDIVFPLLFVPKALRPPCGHCHSSSGESEPDESPPTH